MTRNERAQHLAARRLAETPDLRGAHRALPRRPRRGPARDPQYLAWIRTLPCLHCGRSPAQAAHTGPHAIGQKASDYRAVPLCFRCHRDYDSGRLRVRIDAARAVVDLNQRWRLMGRTVKEVAERWRATA